MQVYGHAHVVMLLRIQGQRTLLRTSCTNNNEPDASVAARARSRTRHGRTLHHFPAQILGSLCTRRCQIVTTRRIQCTSFCAMKCSRQHNCGPRMEGFCLRLGSASTYEGEPATSTSAYALPRMQNACTLALVSPHTHG